jgi:hypothetical protein
MDECQAYDWILAHQIETLKNLKLITLTDHQWHLRSSDYNFVGVVKVTCISLHSYTNVVFKKKINVQYFWSPLSHVLSILRHVVPSVG